MHQNYWSEVGLVKLQIPGPSLRVSDLAGLRQSLRIRISNKFSGDVNAASPGEPHLETLV